MHTPAPAIEIPSRLDVIRAHRAHGGRVAAALPYHYPRALLCAFDILPVEVWGPPNQDVARGAAHLQPYVCSLVRNALAFLTGLEPGAVDYVLVPHGCDSLQGLGSVLLDFTLVPQPVLPLYLPRSTRPGDHAFLAAEFRALYARLAALTGRAPSDDDLRACIAREEAAGAACSALYAARPALPLGPRAFYRVVRAREFLPAEQFIALAEHVLAGASESVPAPGIPLVISGIVPEPGDALDALERMGARIAADDLACGTRRLYPPGTSEEPFARMAESILAAPPDPTRGSPLAARLARLLDLARAAGARGVIFYDVKFCEPELFDLPVLRQGLHAAGLPSLAVEVDLNEPLSQQLLTRLEAFVEMLA
jgi:benzoyl-CoA reductase/2-hydroxyglutaryl-CoA dehydratase subunit BcrC/BadD/HgdB